ncbi:hypothetical protein Q3G72_023010 [Acer saccharum]|nr:hypothetical protein Q3G72_023010 [Acer saccharum]
MVDFDLGLGCCVVVVVAGFGDGDGWICGSSGRRRRGSGEVAGGFVGAATTRQGMLILVNGDRIWISWFEDDDEFCWDEF